MAPSPPSNQAKKFAFKPGDRVRSRDGRCGEIIASHAVDIYVETVDVKFEGELQAVKMEINKLLPYVGPDYIESLDPLYLDLFQAFQMFNPNGRPEWGIAYQSLYSVISDRGYTLGQVREACESLVNNRILIRDNDQFYYPTLTGEAILAAVREYDRSTSQVTVPPFSPPF